MFIAIATEDFNNFVTNNEAETWRDFTESTDAPIFTGLTVEQTRERVENYFHLCCEDGDDIPEYEVCEITTFGIIKGSHKLVTEFSRVN